MPEPMIEEIRLRNLKCFEALDLKFKPLTLLSGANSAGKSTVLQALLLLRQSALVDELENYLVLNGSLLKLGDTSSVLREEAASGAALEIRIVWTDGAEAGWRFLSSPGSRHLTTGTTDGDEIAKQRPPLSDACRYLSAERIGPRSAFPADEYQVEKTRDLGPQGEYTAHFLALHGKSETIQIASLAHQDASSDKLTDQVEAWLGIVSPGVHIHAGFDNRLAAAHLGFSFPGIYGRTNQYGTVHVGFGLTYILPILVSVLSAKPGDLVLLENPEAHLHPAAQRALARLFALAADAGVQIVVETHSDHILNGVRCAVASSEIGKEKTAFHHFLTEYDPSGVALRRVVSPTIDASGRFDEWPAGFFDEWDQALEEILTGEPTPGPRAGS
jgi:predicted ATPase